MNYSKRALVISPVVILLCLAITAVYEFRKPHADAGSRTTDFHIDAESLYKDFAKNESTANAKYLDKIIEVTGKVDDIENTNGATVIIISANQSSGGISCKMFNKTNSFQKGQEITIKGKCSGFLSDVNLVDCVLKSN
jgi:hypothetical protein